MTIYFIRDFEQIHVDVIDRLLNSLMNLIRTSYEHDPTGHFSGIRMKIFDPILFHIYEIEDQT